MCKWIQSLARRVLLWFLPGGQVAQFENVRISDLSKGEPEFKTMMLAAFQLLKDMDPRRFVRANRHLKWVANIALGGGAVYRDDMQACVIDFKKPESDADIPFHVAWYASVLVHAATHAAVAARKIPYSRKFRVRIERLCVTEQNRFARRFEFTEPDIAEYLHREVDETEWERYWETSTGRVLAFLRRVFKKKV